MAGTGWKAAGTVLIVLGAFGVLVGIGGAVFGGMVLSDAVSDSENCGGVFQRPCSRDLDDRGEAGGTAMVAGGALAFLGLILVVIGVVLVFVGVSAARKEQMRAIAGRPQ